MPPLNQNEKVTFDNCTKIILARHEERCSAETMSCSQRPNFSTTFQVDLNCRIVKKQNASKPAVSFNCKLCYQEFPRFYALRQHKSTQHGFSIKTANLDPEDIMNEEDDTNLKEEVRSCQHFLVISELEGVGHKVSNYVVENFYTSKRVKKLDHFFNNLNCAVKVNLAVGFFIKNYTRCKFQLFLRTRKLCFTGSAHQARLGKTKSSSQQN